MDRQLIELIKQWREGTENYAEQVGYARGSDFAFRKCADDLEKALARIDAERGKEVVHWRAVLDAEQVPQQLNASLHVVGFRKLRDAESWIASKLDFEGWRYTIEQLFLSPTIPEGMALVSAEPVAWGVLEWERGEPNPECHAWSFIAGWNELAQEHIKDLIQAQIDSGDRPMKYKAYPLAMIVTAKEPKC